MDENTIGWMSIGITIIGLIIAQVRTSRNNAVALAQQEARQDTRLSLFEQKLTNISRDVDTKISNCKVHSDAIIVLTSKVDNLIEVIKLRYDEQDRRIKTLEKKLEKERDD